MYFSRFPFNSSAGIFPDDISRFIQLLRSIEPIINTRFSVTELLKKTIANLINNRRLLRNKFSGAQQQEDKMEKITMKSSDEILMDKIMKVVNEHLDDPALNVEMLASEVGLSRVHVHRKLKELTNLSTRDFIKNIRLQQAAALLAQDHKLTISEIAYATGYTNLSHFSSSFREKYGMSPKEYMNQHR